MSMRPSSLVALLADDSELADERFRMGLARSGLLQRTDSMGTHAHCDWERSLARPLAPHGDFHWSAAYTRELAEHTGRALAAGGLRRHWARAAQPILAAQLVGPPLLRRSAARDASGP
jgi:hypothetical protein